MNCHAASGAPGVLGKTANLKKVGAYHHGADHVASGHNGGKFCWDCHDGHGDPIS
jgi:hypothetical protein